MVKEKTNSIRTYDNEGYKRRAACLCVKDDSEAEVLLVSGSKDPAKWVVPGGGIEPTEDSGNAALRECEEEAGVIGVLGRFVGQFENEERKTRTYVYILLVTTLLDDWDDHKTIGRNRKWFSLADAKAQLQMYKPTQTMYIDFLQKGAAESKALS